jgi:transcriptional regulator with XRE-family HTH domain
MDGATASFGSELRRWRRQRGLTQMALALAAEVSTRHLSWLESGRSEPSRAMVLRLAERLEVPLRERNALLVAAGYAPLYAERAYADPALAGVRQTLISNSSRHRPRSATGAHRYASRAQRRRSSPR